MLSDLKFIHSDAYEKLYKLLNECMYRKINIIKKNKTSFRKGYNLCRMLHF